MRTRYMAAGLAALLIALRVIGAAKGGYFILDRHEDIPGVVRVEWMSDSAHLPMLEEPQATPMH